MRIKLEAYLYCEKCHERVRGFEKEGITILDVHLKNLYESSTARCPVCGKIAHVRLVVEESEKEAEQTQEPQVKNDIDYGASCEHVHPGQSCGEWIRSQVYHKL